MAFLGGWPSAAFSVLNQRQAGSQRGAFDAAQLRRKQTQEDEDRARQREMDAMQMALLQARTSEMSEPDAPTEWKPTSKAEYLEVHPTKTEPTVEELGARAQAQFPNRFRAPQSSPSSIASALTQRQSYATKLADELIAAAEAEPDKISTLDQKVRRLRASDPRFKDLAPTHLGAALTRSRKKIKTGDQYADTPPVVPMTEEGTPATEPTAPVVPPIEEAASGLPPLTPEEKATAQSDPGFKAFLVQQGYPEEAFQ